MGNKDMNKLFWLLAGAVANAVLFYLKGSADTENRLTAVYQAQSIDQSERTALANKTLHDHIADIDTQRTKERFDAEEITDNLLADVSRGNKRLFITTKTPVCAVPSTTGTTRMDYASSRTELDRHTAQNLIRLTSRGDTAIRQLGACQDYVTEVNKVLSGTHKGMGK